VYCRTCDHLKKEEEDGVCCNLHSFRVRGLMRTHPFLPIWNENVANKRRTLRLNIVPISPTGSIFYGDFRLSPSVFSVFYEHRGGGGGRPY
jgi:hypothetical protein